MITLALFIGICIGAGVCELAHRGRQNGSGSPVGFISIDTDDVVYDYTIPELKTKEDYITINGYKFSGPLTRVIVARPWSRYPRG